MNNNSCYMCDARATSREHVPPSCFFPSQTEIGADYRKNLITVPSCEIHNSQKSHDDEFFRSIVLMFGGINHVGKHQFMGKFLRAAARAPTTYRALFQDMGQVQQGRALQIDRDRLDRCVDHFARAVFFASFDMRWTATIDSHFPQMFNEIKDNQPVPHGPTRQATDLIWSFLGNQPVLGENEDVFRYRIRYEPDGDVFVLAAEFYQSFQIFTYSHVKTAEKAV